MRGSTESAYGVFRQFSHRTSIVVGSPVAFTGALFVVIVWAVVGPLFHYSDTWQLTINTGTTIVTFLMVFVIQNTQNRDAQVMQLKLDELIRAGSWARRVFPHKKTSISARGRGGFRTVPRLCDR